MFTFDHGDIAITGAGSDVYAAACTMIADTQIYVAIVYTILVYAAGVAYGRLTGPMPAPVEAKHDISLLFLNDFKHDVCDHIDLAVSRLAEPENGAVTVWAMPNGAKLHGNTACSYINMPIEQLQYIELGPDACAWLAQCTNTFCTRCAHDLPCFAPTNGEGKKIPAV